MPATNELKYLVGFSKIPGIGRVRLSQIQHYFPSLEQAWKAPTGELRQAGLDSRTITSIITTRAKINPDEELEKLEKFNVHALSYRSPEYPERLKEIDDYPPVLYVRGQLPLDDAYCLAVVGTRHSTMYGRQVTEDIVTDLARNGITIISGLAKGIDTIAHKSALNAGGRTIAVFACGLDLVYPSENARLAHDIMEHGAIISEYPLGTRPKPDHFPRRNRIMSGMSLGIIVIEAGEHSGALITANQAVEQNREVFAVPGSVLSTASKGPNRLIQEGAKLVRNATDILEELNLTIVTHQLEMPACNPANEIESTLVQHLSSEPLHIDEICRRSGMPFPQVSSTLSMMELSGIVKQVGSMHYALSKSIQ